MANNGGRQAGGGGNGQMNEHVEFTVKVSELVLEIKKESSLFQNWNADFVVLPLLFSMLFTESICVYNNYRFVHTIVPFTMANYATALTLLQLTGRRGLVPDGQ